MINDPKLVACADAMLGWLRTSADEGVGHVDDTGGPAFVTVDAEVDFEELAAVAMASLGIEFDWALHDRSSDVPVDAQRLRVDVIGTDGVTTPGWMPNNVRWSNVAKWRPSLDNYR